MRARVASPHKKARSEIPLPHSSLVESCGAAGESALFRYRGGFSEILSAVRRVSELRAASPDNLRPILQFSLHRGRKPQASL
jgi:hypothetical protein